MVTDDPLGAITDLCLISISQELHLRLCLFHGQPEPESPSSSAGDEDPPNFPVASTPIAIVSLPESPQQDGGNDGSALEGLFETPPEDFPSADGSQPGERLDRGYETVRIDVGGKSEDSSVAIDLGRDTDVVFSEGEVEATQRIEADSAKSQKYRVSKRGLSPKEPQLGDSASERSKFTFSESRNKDAATLRRQSRGELLKFFEMLRSKSVSPSARGPSLTLAEKNTGSAKKLEVELQQNHVEESETKRRLDFSVETVESETEVMNLVPDKEKMNTCDELKSRGNNYSSEGSSDRGKRNVMDIDKFGNNGVHDASSSKMEKEAEKKRMLPATVTGRLTFAGEGEAKRSTRNVADAYGREALKFTEDVTDEVVGEAVPSTVNVAEAGGGAMVMTTGNMADAGGGEALKITGNVTGVGVGEAAAVAENMVEARGGAVRTSGNLTDARGREVGKISGNVNVRDIGGGEETLIAENVAISGGRKVLELGAAMEEEETMLDVLKAAMRNHECETSAKKRGILEIAKDRGMKFPRPSWWPPGKEI